MVSQYGRTGIWLARGGGLGANQNTLRDFAGPSNKKKHQRVSHFSQKSKKGNVVNLLKLLLLNFLLRWITCSDTHLKICFAPFFVSEITPSCEKCIKRVEKTQSFNNSSLTEQGLYKSIINYEAVWNYCLYWQHVDI